jgi:hypothetical protein
MAFSNPITTFHNPSAVILVLLATGLKQDNLEQVMAREKRGEYTYHMIQSHFISNRGPHPTSLVCIILNKRKQQGNLPASINNPQETVRNQFGAT